MSSGDTINWIGSSGGNIRGLSYEAMHPVLLGSTIAFLLGTWAIGAAKPASATPSDKQAGSVNLS